MRTLLIATSLGLMTFTGAASAEPVPTRFDAAAENNRGEVYMFSGDKYVRYNIGSDRIWPGYPKPIRGNWKGLPWTSNLDAAFSHLTTIYFFKGGSYILFDIGRDRAQGRPRPLSDWKGLRWPNIDAAISTGGNVTFFRRGMYVTYDIKTKRLVDGPKRHVGNWNGLSAKRVDAAFNAVNGKAYFFQQDKYIRYDLRKRRKDRDYPKSIKGNWKRGPIKIIDASGGGV